MSALSGLGGVLGQQTTLQSVNCAFNLANSSLSAVSGNPDALTLSLNVTFLEQNSVGTHEVYAWGTNSDGFATSQTDLGALVVSPGQDFVLNVSPSGTTTVPYGGTATLTVTATGLNGFTGLINLTISPTGCFALWGDINYLMANGQGKFTLQNWCPSGGPAVQFVITGYAPSIGVARAGSANPTLLPGASGDFTITLNAPSPSGLAAQGSISYAVSIASVSGLGGAVNLSLAPPAGTGMPAGVTYQFAPSQVFLSSGASASSTLTLSSSANTPGGAFPLVVTGALGSLQRAAAFSLGTQVTTFQVTSATGSAIVHNNGQQGDRRAQRPSQQRTGLYDVQRSGRLGCDL